MMHCHKHKIDFGLGECPACLGENAADYMIENRKSKTVNETLDERAKTHGDFEEYANIVEAFKYTTRNASLNNAQTAGLDMIFSKIARIVNGNPNEPDHWHDIAGYAALVERSINNG